MATVARSGLSRAPRRKGRVIPLFWRLFLPNAAVLAAACAFLILAPPNGRVPILVSGLVVMLITNLVLMRWAFAPLQRLFSLMRRVDPLAPGRRLSVGGPESEVTELARAFNEMLDRLETERRDSARRALAAQESERRRVASELHDEVGQALTAVMLEIDRMARRAPPDLRDELAYARDTAATSLEDVRRIARRLRPEALDDLGLASALHVLGERIAEHSGLDVDVYVQSGLPEFGGDAELVLYRVAQEALTNVARHADASSAEVRLELSGGRPRLEVLDDGKGFPLDGLEGGGVRGMRERAVLIGGALRLTRGPKGGTRVTLELPPE